MFYCNFLSPTCLLPFFFFFNDTATTEIYTLSLHDALPIYDLLEPAAVATEIERDDRRPLADQRADGPGADAAERARDEEAFRGAHPGVLDEAAPTAAPAPTPISVRRRFVSRPMPSISTVTTEPSARNRGGSRNTPTPPGVPVAITSPGSRLNAWEQWLMISATPKNIIAVFDDWTTSPSTVQEIAWRCGSPISSAVTSAGPIGQNVSSDLPRTHCPSPNWISRADTSLRHV